MAKKRGDTEQLKSIEKKQGVFGAVGIAAFLVLIISVAILMFTDFNDVVAGIMICSGLVFGICLLASKRLDENTDAIIVARQKREAAQLKSIKRDAAQVYLDYCDELEVPDYTCVSGDKEVWVDSSKIHVLETIDSYLAKYKEIEDYEQTGYLHISHGAIPVSQVQYFSKEGDIQYTANVSGGGGGGSSIKGAVIGGVIAGGAGAIIGSRQKVEAIKTDTEAHDTRKTVIRFYAKNTIRSISFDGFEVYDYLLQFIPDKDLLTMQLNQGQGRNAIPAGNGDTKSRLQSLKELYDSGLLDAAEYQEKRREILGGL